MPKRAPSNTGILLGLGTVGVVLLAAMTFVAFTASSGAFGDDGAADVRTVGWQVAKQDTDDETATSFPSSDGDVIVRVGTSEVVGYDFGDGDEDWTVQLPTNYRTCAATNVAPDDIAAVVIGMDGECTDLLAVDVDKGKQAWRAELRGGTDDAPKEAAVTAAKGRVFVSTASGIARYDAERGPDAEGNEKPAFTKAPRGCELGGSARANDRAVFAIMECTVPPRLPTQQPMVKGYLTGFAAKDLKGFIRTELGTGSGIKDRLDVVTPAPIVVRDVDEDERGVLRFFDGKGKQTAELDAKQDGKGTLDLGTRAGLGVDSDRNRQFVFQQVEKNMVVPLVTDDGQKARVAGVNLEKGTWTWTQTVGRTTKNSTVVLTVADDEQKEVAAVESGDGVMPQLVGIGGKKGELDRDDLLPADAAPTKTDSYMNLGPGLIRLGAGESDTELLTAYGR